MIGQNFPIFTDNSAVNSLYSTSWVQVYDQDQLPMANLQRDMAMRNTPGYGIGLVLRRVFEYASTFFGVNWPPKSTTKRAGPERDQYPWLTEEEAACMVLHEDKKNYQTPIRYFIIPQSTAAENAFLRARLDHANGIYGIHSAIAFKEASTYETSDINFGFMRTGELLQFSDSDPASNITKGTDGVASMPSMITGRSHPVRLHIENIHASSATYSWVTCHEYGHAYLGLAHPFAVNSTWIVNTSSVFEKNIFCFPELTVMGYNSVGRTVYFRAPTPDLFVRYHFIREYYVDEKNFIHKCNTDQLHGIGFCDAVIAREKYGSNRQHQGKAIHVDLANGPHGAIVLPSLGAKSVVLDGRNAKSPIEFVLGPSFKPTRTPQGSLYLNLIHTQTQVDAYTSLHEDLIIFSHPVNHLYVTGGAAKTLVVRAGVGLNMVDGFRQEDKLVLQGFSTADREKFKFFIDESGIHCSFPTKEGNSRITLRGWQAPDFSNLRLYFDPNHSFDGFSYMTHMYAKNSYEYIKAGECYHPDFASHAPFETIPPLLFSLQRRQAKQPKPNIEIHDAHQPKRRAVMPSSF